MDSYIFKKNNKNYIAAESNYPNIYTTCWFKKPRKSLYFKIIQVIVRKRSNKDCVTVWHF